MNKKANLFIKADPYKIIEEGFHKERNQVAESIFSLGNEYMGIRGAFDEGSSNLKTLRGSYFNGIYEYAKEDTPSAYKGIVKRTHFMINSVDWVNTEIILDGEKVDLGSNDFSDFSRELDLLSGELVRTFVLNLHSKSKVKLIFKRLVDMSNCHRGYQIIEIQSLSQKKIDVEIHLNLNSNVLHWGKDCYYMPEKEEVKNDSLLLTARTLTTEQHVISSMKIKTNVEYSPVDEKKPLFVGRVYKFVLPPSKKAFFERYVVNIALKKPVSDISQKEDEALRELDESYINGYQKAYESNVRFFKGIFDKSDIQIDGDLSDQQGIRFCLFQLTQTYHGYSPSDNIGAKGLTGEAYSGHAFWDSETYCLPYYLLTNMEAAKDLLMFRYNTLGEAKKRALDLDCQGACYPIATLNGKEGCNLWQHASLQFQPSTGVSYAIFHYYNLTDDSQFIKEYGLEMLIEISHFLLDRGQYDSTGKHFGFYGVMGPDEFKVMVNNNTYTNFMAKKTFDFTLEMFDKFGSDSILKKCNINKDFFIKIRKASESMKILYDSKTKLFEQNDGFFSLPHLDINSIPQEDFPLYSHWTYDRIYRYDMIKQPDVLMFIFLYSSSFTLEQKEANYDYYEPRCIHESSLSPSIHSIFACELGKEKEALNFFSYATRLDLDDYNMNTSEGLHTTSLAAAFMNIVYGFGGVRTDGDILVINPSLPSKWSSYSFKISYKGRNIKVELNKHKTTVSIKGSPFMASIKGKVVFLAEDQPYEI